VGLRRKDRALEKLKGHPGKVIAELITNSGKKGKKSKDQLKLNTYLTDKELQNLRTHVKSKAQATTTPNLTKDDKAFYVLLGKCSMGMYPHEVDKNNFIYLKKDNNRVAKVEILPYAELVTDPVKFFNKFHTQGTVRQFARMSFSHATATATLKPPMSEQQEKIHAISERATLISKNRKFGKNGNNTSRFEDIDESIGNDDNADNADNDFANIDNDEDHGDVDVNAQQDNESGEEAGNVGTEHVIEEEQQVPRVQPRQLYPQKTHTPLVGYGTSDSDIEVENLRSQSQQKRKKSGGGKSKKRAKKPVSSDSDTDNESNLDTTRPMDISADLPREGIFPELERQEEMLVEGNNSSTGKFLLNINHYFFVTSFLEL
jgi:uncharacterized membrane-anchored protein YhcB (DUF1043 family)